MIRPINSGGRARNSVAGRKKRDARATGKTTSVAIGNVATKTRGEITTIATASATMIVGDATIATAMRATAMGDLQIETARNGDAGKRTRGVNVRRTFDGVKMIASASGRFAISTFAKCAA